MDSNDYSFDLLKLAVNEMDRRLAVIEAQYRGEDAFGSEEECDPLIEINQCRGHGHGRKKKRKVSRSRSRRRKSH